MRQLLAIFVIVSAVAACGGVAPGGDPATSTSPSTLPAPTTTLEPDAPVDSGGDEPIVDPGPAGSIPEPRPPIEGNIDGEVWITTADLRIMESFPIQVMLDVTGDKPTACHEIFWTVEDDGEVIAIEMISQIASDQQCAQVIEEFAVAVPLGSWAGETRQVRLNGAVVASFES